MDKSNDLLDTCFSLAHLMDAAKFCARNVSWKGLVQRFSVDRLCQCARLRKEILADEWRPTPVKPFTLLERGKIRKVRPVNMRDRVVERCFCEHVLIPMVKRSAIRDSSACIRGRGLHYAIEHVRRHLEKAEPGAWVFQFDFHDYFHAIDRERLVGMLRGELPEPYVHIASLCIGGEHGIGLELGSHVCQILAVWYPTPLDRFVEFMPGFVGYHRYMDDGLAVFESKAHALNARYRFINAAQAIGLEMNPHKTICNRATHPIVFCKTRLVKRASGVRVTVRKPQTRHMVRHIRNVIKLAERRDIDLTSLSGACLGYLNRGDADLTRLLTDQITWPPGMPY